MVGDNKHKMGYIKDDGTLTDVTFAYYDWLSIDPLKEPDCSDCKYLPICGGGCRMLSYRQTGTYHAAGCEKVKGVIEKQIEVYVRRQVQFQTDCLLSLYQYTQCIGIHRIHSWRFLKSLHGLFSASG